MLEKLGPILGNWLPAYNSRTVAPPGKIERKEGPLVLVATVMRSGSHLLIDCLLNNFSALRGRPLYLDLDQLIDQDVNLNNLLGGYIVKTHYPQIRRQTPEREQIVRSLAERSVVVSTHRGLEDILVSMRTWGLVTDRREVQESIARFEAFWPDREIMEFEDLRALSRLPTVVMRLSGLIGLPADKVLVAARPLESRGLVYLDKVLTRLLGAKAPIINTTIRFARR